MVAAKSKSRAVGTSPQKRTESEAFTCEEDILSVLNAGMSTATVNPGGQDSDILAMVREGLPFAALENVVAAIGAPQQEVANTVGIPASTLSRRRKSGWLTSTESDQLVRVARLAAMALAMMADDADASQRWLTTPHRLLDGESPLRRASTETGGREVEQLIGQLRHGVFS